MMMKLQPMVRALLTIRMAVPVQEHQSRLTEEPKKETVQVRPEVQRKPPTAPDKPVPKTLRNPIPPRVTSKRVISKKANSRRAIGSLETRKAAPIFVHFVNPITRMSFTEKNSSVMPLRLMKS